MLPTPTFPAPAPGTTSRLRFRRVLAGLVACASVFAAAPASADGAFPKMLSEVDRQRLDEYQDVRRITLDYVRKHGSAADVKLVDGVMAGEAAKLAPAKMAGDWRCRVIKLSQKPDLPIIAYSDFKCRITDDGAGLSLQKLTGSQRTNGTFYDTNDKKLAYVGALSLGDTKRVTRYGENQESNDVGYLIPLSAKRMRLELPSPMVESDFDVLELRR